MLEKISSYKKMQLDNQQKAKSTETETQNQLEFGKNFSRHFQTKIALFFSIHFFRAQTEERLILMTFFTW